MKNRGSIVVALVLVALFAVTASGRLERSEQAGATTHSRRAPVSHWWCPEGESCSWPWPFSLL